MTEKEYIGKCEDCGEVKKVKDTICPFDYEIHDKKTPVTLCEDCDQLRADEI